MNTETEECGAKAIEVATLLGDSVVDVKHCMDPKSGTITYQEAMRSSTDPDDLDLKLRRFFPKLLEQEKEMSSSADYSQIFELLQYRKLYEEQDEKIKIQLAEKDELIGDLRQWLARQS